MSNNPKIFVLDTNVLLHDHNALSNFQENDIVIPIIVLEELDKFKKATTRSISMHVNSLVNWIKYWETKCSTDG